MIWVALGLTLETAIFILAALACLRSWGYTFAEAGAGAILMVFVAFSLIHQLSFFAGSPAPAFILEALALTVSLYLGMRRGYGLTGLFRPALQILRQEASAGGILVAAWGVMAGLVPLALLSLSPASATLAATTHPWPGWMAFSTHGGPLAAGGPIPPLNMNALFYHTIRFGLPPNACGFGLLAHVAIGLATYALARRYAWPPMALTVTLMVVSMPRMVALGLQPSPELISAAAVTYSLVLVYRLLEQHQAMDLYFLLACIMFSIHAYPMGFALALLLVLLMVVSMIRRHGWILWGELLASKPLLGALGLVLVLLLAQVPAAGLNLVQGRPLFTTAATWEDGGLLAAVRNLMAYLLVSIDCTEPLRQVVAAVTGVDLNRLLGGLYGGLTALLPGQGGDGAGVEPIFSGLGTIGFGPAAAFLILPAMVYAFVRGPRRLKAIGVAWGGYLYLASLTVAWHPDNLELLSPLYAANGFMVAFALPPYRLRRRGMRILQVIFAVLLAWTLTRVAMCLLGG